VSGSIAGQAASLSLNQNQDAEILREQKRSIRSPLLLMPDRMTFFVDRSDDRLGQLAEINKTQLEQALRDVKSFARTDAGFNNRMLQRQAGNLVKKDGFKVFDNATE